MTKNLMMMMTLVCVCGWLGSWVETLHGSECECEWVQNEFPLPIILGYVWKDRNGGSGKEWQGRFYKICVWMLFFGREWSGQQGKRRPLTAILHSKFADPQNRGVEEGERSMLRHFTV